jgi:hypothetical protein
MVAQRRGNVAAIALTILTLSPALWFASPLRAGKVVTARITSYSGASEGGNLQEALDAAIHNASAQAPGADRQTVWKVTRISGLAGGLKPAKRVIVTIEAHW